MAYSVFDFSSQFCHLFDLVVVLTIHFAKPLEVFDIIHLEA